MKKFFMYAVAAVATMSLTSCLSEEETNLEKGNMGYISLNASANNELYVTRADDPVNAPTTWKAVVSGGTTPYDGTIAGLAATAFQAGTTYSVHVGSNTDLKTALAAADGFGEGYWSGDATSITVEKGKTTPVNIACGAAKNAKLNITASGFTSANGIITALTVTGTDGDEVSPASRTVTFKDATHDNLATTAFFKADDPLTYSISYSINGINQTYTNASDATKLSLTAGTANTLSITANSNGKIGLTVTYESEFGTGISEEIEIDGATGVATKKN